MLSDGNFYSEMRFGSCLCGMTHGRLCEKRVNTRIVSNYTCGTETFFLFGRGELGGGKVKTPRSFEAVFRVCHCDSNQINLIP